VRNWLYQPPAEVQAFIDGEGVEYAPAGAGYTIRLPGTPEEVSTTQNVMGRAVTMHGAVIERDEWEAGVVVIDLPAAVPAADTEAVMRGAISGGNSSISGAIKDQEVTTHEGFPALDVEIEPPDGHPFLARLTIANNRLYMVMAHSVRAADAMFDELVASFHLA
jgi:hypothetical protein